MWKETKINGEVITVVKDYIEKQQYINVDNIKSILEDSKYVQSISKSSIRRLLKTDLNAKYRKTELISKCKNSHSNKIYRKFFVIEFLKYFSSNRIVVSLEETGFTSSKTERR